MHFKIYLVKKQEINGQIVQILNINQDFSSFYLVIIQELL